MLDKALKRISLEKKLWLIRNTQKNFVPEDQLYLFSDPRGGSTWLTELLLEIPDTTVLWEPLRPDHIKELKKLHFSFRQHIPKDAFWPEAKLVFDKINSGSIINEWTALKTTPERFKKANKLIIKYCRGNALLPWFCEQYDIKLPPVYLIRHPFGVAASQLKQGGWDYQFKGFNIPGGPYNNLYLKHKEFLLSLKSKEEALVATWCLTNMVPLSESNKKWIEVFYEDLVIQPEVEINKIFDQWSMDIPPNIVTKVRTPSSTSLKRDDIIAPEKQLSSWKDYFNEHQLDKMQNVLDYFDVELYSKMTIYPIST